MDSADIERDLRQTEFVFALWETENTPCTGLTAVHKQKRRKWDCVWSSLAPWRPQMREAEKALRDGRVVPTACSFTVDDQTVDVLVTTDNPSSKIYYLYPRANSPYEYRSLEEETLYFAKAVEAFLHRHAAIPTDRFVCGCEWESVPSLHLVGDRCRTLLELHNVFDARFENASAIDERFAVLDGGQCSALELGLRSDAVTAVNRGFAFSLRHEPFYTSVLVDHLAGRLGCVQGIDNAGFNVLPGEFAALHEQLTNKRTFRKGCEQLERLQQSHRNALPGQLRDKIGQKVLVVTIGRRVAQKQHDVLVEATRNLLSRSPATPLFVFFATVHGDAGSPARQERIRQLADQFPDHVAFSTDRLDYYDNLMNAADFNCMPSLWEPHGGCFSGAGLPIPLARAVDGLAEQICSYNPVGQAKQLNETWHEPGELPSGLTFREIVGDASEDEVSTQLRELLVYSPSPANKTFLAMVRSVEEALVQAMQIRQEQPETFARLVQGALAKQMNGWSWNDNLAEMRAVMVP